jgi:hypothetical protein
LANIKANTKKEGVYGSSKGGREKSRVLYFDQKTIFFLPTFLK